MLFGLGPHQDGGPTSQVHWVDRVDPVPLNTGGSPAFWNQGGDRLTPWACVIWAHSGGGTSATLNHLGVIHPSLSLKDKTWSLPDSSCSSSRGSEIWQVFLHFYPMSVPCSPSWLYFCWSNPISIPNFCWHGQLDLWVAHVISLSNDCPATPLVFSSEMRSHFFPNTDRLRILWVSKSWFLLASQFFFFFLIYLFIFGCIRSSLLGLSCCMQAFSTWGERGLLFVAVHGLLIVVASLVAEYGL